jgi:DNA polymerase III epsilon subunit-like protein
MAKPAFIVLDTETGGLQARFNPLLSVAVVVCDTELNVVEGHGTKISPPDNCLLQIPIPQDMFNEKTWNPRTAYWLNLTTGEHVDASFKPLMSIAAKAAEINGFITAGPDGKWDLESCRPWIANGLPRERVESSYRQLLRTAFGEDLAPGSLRTMAYNGSFDAAFLREHMPNLMYDLAPKWLDPCEMAKKMMQAKTPGLKKGWKLVQMAKEAGYEEHAAHDAYGDCLACLAVFRWLQAQGVEKAWSC